MQLTLARPRAPLRPVGVRPWATRFLLLAAALAWLVLLRPQALGGPAAYVLVSGRSMEPTLHEGDLAVVVAVAEYRVGDVVTYRVPAGHVAAGAPIIHRIVGGDAQSGWVIEGDNTSGPDLWQPTDAAIEDRLWFSIPAAGRLLALLRDPVVLASLAAAVAVAVVLARPPGEGRQD